MSIARQDRPLDNSEEAPRASRSGGVTPTGWIDRLGGLVERHPRTMVALAGLESRLLGERLEAVPIEAPVYVTGLARSGSTILLELLARHEQLASHRYRDFPPVLLPVAWNWFLDRAAQREVAAEERAHQDRILVTPESPEAFEELVWSAFFAQLHDPAQSTVLDASTSNARFEAFYRDHIRKLLLVRGGRRYLAKGNYNVARLGYLRRLFPDARFVVPVRDPLWHVASLMKQHALFCREGRRDPRVVRHMSRAGHYEFGLDRRAVNLGDGTAPRIEALWRAGAEVEGWALTWDSVYGHLAGVLQAEPALRAATLVVRYEDFCARPGETMARVLEHCRLPPGALPALAEAQVAAPGYYEPAFTAAERALIRERTRETAGFFEYA